MHGLNFGLLVRPAGARKAPRVLELFLFSPRPADLRKVLPAFPRLATSTQIKNVPVLASKKEHTRLSKSALATATRLPSLATSALPFADKLGTHTPPAVPASRPVLTQTHSSSVTLHNPQPLPLYQSELESPRLPPASAARLLTSMDAQYTKIKGRGLNLIYE